MTDQNTQYQDDFATFVAENRPAIDAVIPADIKGLTTEDIRILSNFATYKAGRKHYEERGNTVDKSVIDGIRVFFARPDVDAKEAIRKAFSWYEKGAMNKTSLKAAMFDQPEFSPKVEKYLREKRQDNYRKAFSDMRKSVVKLSQSIRDMRDMLRNSDEPLDSPAMALKVKKQLRSINGALNRCDQCSRAGIAWAHRAGIPLRKATMVIQQLYLTKLPQLEQAIRPVEAVLQSQGLNSSVGNQINRRQFLWHHDIREVRQAERCQEHKHTQDSQYAIG